MPYQPRFTFTFTKDEALLLCMRLIARAEPGVTYTVSPAAWPGTEDYHIVQRRPNVPPRLMRYDTHNGNLAESYAEYSPPRKVLP